MLPFPSQSLVENTGFQQAWITGKFRFIVKNDFFILKTPLKNFEFKFFQT